MRVLAPPVPVAAPIPSTPVAAPIAGCVVVIPGAHHWWRRVGGGSAWRHDNNGRSCRGRCPITCVVVQRSARVPITVPIPWIPAAILSHRQRCTASEQHGGNRHCLQGGHFVLHNLLTLYSSAHENRSRDLAI